MLVESVWDAGYHDVVVFGNYEKADKTITSRDELFKFIESGLDEQRGFYFTKEMKVDRNKKGSTPIMLMDSVADLFTFPNDSQKALKSASVRNPPKRNVIKQSRLRSHQAAEIHRTIYCSLLFLTVMILLNLKP